MNRFTPIAACAALCLLAGGCTTSPTVPQSHVFSTERALPRINAPLPVPAHPHADVGTVGATPAMCFTEAGARALAARDAILMGNTQIAGNAVAAYADLRDADLALRQQALLMEQQYNAATVELAQAQADLDRERMYGTIERWIGWIAAGLVVATVHR
jgi:hypothetical protein